MSLTLKIYISTLLQTWNVRQIKQRACTEYSTILRIRSGQALWVNIKESAKTFSPSICSKKTTIHIHSPSGDALSKSLSKEGTNFSMWFLIHRKNRKNTQDKSPLFMYFCLKTVYTYFLIKAFCTRLYLTALKECKWQHKCKNTLLF